MSDQHRPVALVLARADNPLLPQLGNAMAEQGLGYATCPQAAQAFIQLARRDAAEIGLVVALILEALPGMSVSALAKSVRGLPGRSGLPLILPDDQDAAPRRSGPWCCDRQSQPPTSLVLRPCLRSCGRKLAPRPRTRLKAPQRQGVQRMSRSPPLRNLHIVVLPSPQPPAPSLQLRVGKSWRSTSNRSIAP